MIDSVESKQGGSSKAIKILLYLFRLMTKSIIVILLAASLLVNVASLTFDVFNRILSGAIEMVADGASIRERSAREKAHMEAEMDAQKVNASKARDDLELEKKRTKSLEAELSDEKRRRAKLTNDLKAEKLENSDLRARSEKIRAEADRNDQRAASLYDDLNSERQAVQELEGKTHELQDKLEIEENKNRTLEADNKRLAEKARSPSLQKPQISKIDELTETIAERSAMRINRGLGASAGEVVPVLGAAVVVASLLWDAKDACDTMEEMDQIRENLDLGSTVETTPKSACAKVTELISTRKHEPIQICLSELRVHGTLSEACKKEVSINWSDGRGIDGEEDPAQGINWD